MSLSTRQPKGGAQSRADARGWLDRTLTLRDSEGEDIEARTSASPSSRLGVRPTNESGESSLNGLHAPAKEGLKGIACPQRAARAS